MAIGVTSLLYNGCSAIASSFRMVMAVNLGKVGETPPVVLRGLSVLALLSQYTELDCEENKLEIRLFDKQ